MTLRTKESTAQIRLAIALWPPVHLEPKWLKILVCDVLGHELPGKEGLCSLTVMAPNVVGATCVSKFRTIAGLCAMRIMLGHVWLKSLPPLRCESVQSAFVPKTHADAGLFLLL